MAHSKMQPLRLTEDQVRMLRARAQRLTPQQGGKKPSVSQILQEVCGVQAQELPAAALAIRNRSSGLAASDVDSARLQERSVVRTWCMRGTLHLISVEDFGWLLPLLGPKLLAGSRRRLAQMGLDEAAVAKAVPIIGEVLASRGPLTRAEIARELSQRSGIQAEGQARIHLVYQAAMNGILCCGPERGNEPAYALVEDWVGPLHPLPRAQALKELCLRYLRAYGPAEPRDLAAWSGLSLSEARRGWEQVADLLKEVDLNRRQMWVLTEQTGWLDESPPPTPTVRLLPRYDAYLLGYANRDLAVAPEFAKRINRGGGIIHPALLVDGRAVGTWETKRRRDSLSVVIEPFEELDGSYLAGIRAEVSDLGRFLGVEAKLAG